MLHHFSMSTFAASLSETQSLDQILQLGLAFLLSALIGFERGWHQKAAGLRTHTLVGVGSALFVIVSKYGFTDVLESGRSSLDPSRVAAQVVTGIGFIGGGLIFVRGDIVRGLTTAAIVWMTAAIGMACGAGLWLLAIVVTLGHFLIVLGLPRLAARLPHSPFVPTALRVVYQDGRGVLREVLAEVSRRGFAIAAVETQRHGEAVVLRLELIGQARVHDLMGVLSELDGVLEVGTPREVE
jgi:putative Mg2+ transporter-C (MgtC) family protein